MRRSTDNDTEALIRSTAAGIATACVNKGSSDHAHCWEALCDAGLTHLRSREQPGDDGTIGTTADLAIVVEELARVRCAAPLVISGGIVPELAHRSGVVLSELGSQPVGLALSADLSHIAFGDRSDIVLGGGERSHGLGIRDAEVVLFAVGCRMDVADPSTPMWRADEQHSVLAEIDVRAIAPVVALGRILVAADVLGAAGSVFDLALAYAKDRRQFGVAIGSFQAVKHLCAQSYVHLEGLRSVVLYTSWLFDNGDPGAHRMAEVAKACAAETGIAVAHASMQILGGVSATWEHPAHFFLRRLHVDRLLLGDDRAICTSLGSDPTGVPDAIR